MMMTIIRKHREHHRAPSQCELAGQLGESQKFKARGMNDASFVEESSLALIVGRILFTRIRNCTIGAMNWEPCGHGRVFPEELYIPDLRVTDVGA